MSFSGGHAPSYRNAREIARIAARHVFLPINAIIFVVVILLYTFGQTNEGLFLGAVVLLNIALGFAQDVRAWLTLERLQFLTAIQVIKLQPDGTETETPLEALTKGDRIKIKNGDQMPCDGTIVEGTSLEVSEGLITGESTIFTRATGEAILAGSVITSGFGIAELQTSFADSRIAKMAAGLQRYSANPSPIQQSITLVITYTVYVLLAVTAFIVVRGAIMHQSNVAIVQSIGALAGVLVPQGLVVAVTLLFTFGASHFYRRNVLLQEVNATEKFGRIKNLCMDKTGTLTENNLTVDRLHPSPGTTEAEARAYASLYVRFSGDSSQSISALREFLGEPPAAEVSDTLSFSSTRKYGGIRIADNMPLPSKVVLVGAPDVFAPHVRSETERRWLSDLSTEHAQLGKRVLCIATCEDASVPRALVGTTVAIAGVCILHNALRTGITDAVNFFQDRGVTIRIISGDHPDTVRTIARAAGVRNTDALILGEDMNDWSEADYVQHAHTYTIFARIQPEQKEKIIEALKLSGYTAMVGDGANDALSIKKADLGIAMFDGATATRQIAAVVLLGNSFVELPGGVRLADSMIENIEIFASVFFNQTFLGFLFFIGLTLIGLDYPLTPLTINFINYFTVGIPGMLISWWAINPSERTSAASTQPFLSRTIPFSLALSLLQAVTVFAVYLSVQAYLPSTNPSGLLTVTFAALGFIYFVVSTRYYGHAMGRAKQLTLAALGVLGASLLYLAFKLPIVLVFFNLTPPTSAGVTIALVLAAVCGAIQYGMVRIFFKRPPGTPHTVLA
ncbi:MAG: HAD-IC family P-type ATPase [Candidatus Paceibacterota bacterium]